MERTCQIMHPAHDRQSHRQRQRWWATATCTSRRLTLAPATTQASREVEKLLPGMCSGRCRPGRSSLWPSGCRVDVDLAGFGLLLCRLGGSLFAE